MRSALLCTILLAPALAHADLLAPVPDRGLSTADGATLGAGKSAAYATAGWPVLAIGYMQGVVDSVDLSGEIGIDAREELALLAGWFRYSLYGDESTALAATVRLEAGFGRPLIGHRGMVLEATPGLQLGLPAAKDTLVELAAELPLRLGISGRPSGALFGVSVGVDRALGGGTLGLFGTLATPLSAGTGIQLGLGVRGSLAL